MLGWSTGCRICKKFVILLLLSPVAPLISPVAPTPLSQAPIAPQSAAVALADAPIRSAVDTSVPPPAAHRPVNTRAQARLSPRLQRRLRQRLRLVWQRRRGSGIDLGRRIRRRRRRADRQVWHATGRVVVAPRTALAGGARDEGAVVGNRAAEDAAVLPVAAAAALVAAERAAALAAERLAQAVVARGARCLGARDAAIGGAELFRARLVGRRAGGPGADGV